MTDLQRGYLSQFPVQYHRNQVASGVVEHAARPAGRADYSTDIYFANSFLAGRNQGADEHNAIDIMGAIGLRIVATCSGRIAQSWRTRGGEQPGVGRDPRSRGGGYYVMVIDDVENYYHYYAHLQEEPRVNEGDYVSAGTLIGSLGDTGKARGTPPHLHYQVSRRSSETGALRSFLNPYEELVRLARDWLPGTQQGWRIRLPVSGAGPSGFDP